MKLIGCKLLMLVSDGIEQEEVEEIKKGFERELAEVFLTSPHEYLTVETVANARRGKDIVLDFPIEAAEPTSFDGLILPSGLLSTDILRKEPKALALIREFHSLNLPIFASGRAVDLLYESGILPDQVLVRDTGPLTAFVEQATNILLDTSSLQLYRPVPRV